MKGALSMIVTVFSVWESMNTTLRIRTGNRSKDFFCYEKKKGGIC